jgi:hypothetical protein
MADKAGGPADYSDDRVVGHWWLAIARDQRVGATVHWEERRDLVDPARVGRLSEPAGRSSFEMHPQ